MSTICITNLSQKKGRKLKNNCVSNYNNKTQHRILEQQIFNSQHLHTETSIKPGSIAPI